MNSKKLWRENTVDKWKFYNGAIISDNEPRNPVVKSVDCRTLFSRFKSAYFIKYISKFDLPKETEWWYCIKDDAFKLDNLKSKRKNIVKKGKDNFLTKEIDPQLYIEDFYEIMCKSILEYNHKVQIDIKEVERKCAYLSKNQNCKIIGAFFRECPSKLVGYLWLSRNGKCINLVEQHVIPEYEKLQINAALVLFACEILNNDLEKGYYLSDGERNILHQTAFQEYLEKYFGFRKAYCDLNIVYRPWVAILVHLLFPFRNKINEFVKKHDISITKKINSVLLLETIRRDFNE